MIKWITSTLPTGQNMTRRQQRFQSLCPLCITTVETHLHLIQCPAPTASATWEAGLASLSIWLTQEDTQPQLRRSIIRILRLCRRHGWSSPWILYDVSPTITQMPGSTITNRVATIPYRPPCKTMGARSNKHITRQELLDAQGDDGQSASPTSSGAYSSRSGRTETPYSMRPRSTTLVA